MAMVQHRTRNEDSFECGTEARRIAFAVTLCSWLMVPTGQSAEFDLGLQISETFTDNVELAPEGLEEEEWVTQVTPTLSWLYDQTRIDATVNYELQGFFYSDVSDRNEIYHRLNSEVTGAVIPEFFYIQADAGITQVNVDPTQRLARTNLTISDNRTDTITYAITPYIDKKFADGLRLFARYSEGRADYDNPTIEDVEIREGELQFGTITDPERRFLWGVEYESARLDYDRSSEAELQRAGLRVGLALSPSMRLSVIGGQESDYVDLTDGALEDSFWEAALSWRGERAELDLAAGERSFGTTFRATYAQTVSNLRVQLSYDESPSNGEALLRQRRRVNEADALQDGVLDRPGRAQRFVRVSSQLTLDWEFQRSSLALGVYQDEREDRIDINGVRLPDEKQAGARGQWIWQLGQRSSLDIGAGKYERDVADRVGTTFVDRSFDSTYGSIGFNYQLGLRTSIRLSVAREEQEGDFNVVDDYEENRITLSLFRDIL